jgi:hypothetical protein
MERPKSDRSDFGSGPEAPSASAEGMGFQLEIGVASVPLKTIQNGWEEKK